MTDVLFYQNYTYVADISAIVLCIICCCILPMRCVKKVW